MNPAPFLVVDKKGLIGETLCKELISRALIVYVCQKQSSLEKVVFIPYGRGAPEIPNYTYSHIFIIDDDFIVEEYLTEFTKKAEKDNASLVFVTNLSKASSFYKKVEGSSVRIKTVVIGDIVGNNIYPMLIYNAIKFGKIELANDGLSKTYPVFLEDVVSGIIDAAFDKDTKASIFYLFPKHPPTELSLARMIQKANPTVQVDFSKTRSRHSGALTPYPLPKGEGAQERARLLERRGQGEGGFWTRRVPYGNPSSQNDIGGNGKYLLPDNYPLEKKIRELNIEGLMGRRFNTSTLSFDPELASTELSRMSRTEGLSINPELVEWVNKDSFNFNRNVKPRRLFPFRRLLLVLFLLLIMPFILTLVFSISGFAMLENAKTAIEKGSMANAQKSASAAKLLFSLAKKSSILLLTQGKLIRQEKNLGTITKNIDMGSDLSQMAIYVADGSEILSEVFAGTSKNPKNDFGNAAKDLKSAIAIFRQIDAEGKLQKDVQVKTKSVDNLIRIAENTIDYAPNIFGLNGKKVYLVLFQNNMELRPGGGFIGSYGLLTFDAGKIADFSIADVYDADGQLRGHVEPPYPIRRYLSLPHLYLRDSNFDVDFAKGASSSAILLNAELDVVVDGVIGMDVSFVKSILEAIGPIFVADYKETVTSSNLYELTQSYAEKNFFAGSRQKKDFLRSLFSAMQLKLSANNNLFYLKIAKSIDEAISQKHLLFAFSDKNLQDLFTVNKWSSALWDERRSTDSINDFLGINEANIGVNKANYFVKRNVIHNVMIDENGNTRGEINIDYKNTSNKWPGGDYINYLRIILPLNTTISSISFGGVSQDIVSAITDPLVYEAKNFVAPLGLEVERYEQSGKTIYGFLVNIKAGKSKAIKIEYVTDPNISLEPEAFSYSLRIFKQPGTESYPYSFLLTHPNYLRVINGLASFSGSLEGDKEISVSFAPR